MSSSFGLVRFPHGEILLGHYSGTSDTFSPQLVEAPMGEPWPSPREINTSERSTSNIVGALVAETEAAIRKQAAQYSFGTMAQRLKEGLQTEVLARGISVGWSAAMEACAVPVDIYADHGGGTHWKGTGVLQAKLLISGFEWGSVEHGQTAADCFYVPYEDGAPEWANEFIRDHGASILS